MSEPSTEGYSPINIRNLSIKCGQCLAYQTLTAYEPGEEWNVYTYECEGQRCDPAVTRTLVEVPKGLDEFARRDPAWRGGRRFGGEE
jgi:hypothetical protein